ncbi:rhomboid family intramembrane serine protease [Bifidobacterium oedipodis]|uniref:Rhomboid family intramembrane serine protease n=1 Tax=Bifidobacterium oedipodis TaxID=2675322 RepID=A0A7Y0EQS8_9BIFI|nr:rhomboid family intramembrane serine protease [Bifidobacterium sp. DSM 109957]NMM94733.1 rhomboid family intramembrane serine protease [Bifidobacterium sp. DSM 109957]
MTRFSMFPQSPMFGGLNRKTIAYEWKHGGPVITWAIILVCVAVWLIEVLLGFLSPILQGWFISMGMIAPSAVMRMPWTLVTSMFLHAPNSIMHILFNMIALYSVGPVLERMMGHWRFLGLYMISGFGGSLGLMVWAVVAPNGQGWQGAAYGASGALFGLFAALLVVYRRIGVDIRSMLVWMAINFLLPFVVGGVAWQAHIGGFVVGGALTWLLVAGIPAWHGKSLAWRMRVYGGTMTVLVLALIALCNLANPYSAML